MAQSESTAPEAPPTDESAVEDQLTSLFAAEDPSENADSEVAQAQDAPKSDDAESESADAQDDSDSQDEGEDEGQETQDQPVLVKVKVDGKEVEIPLDEAIKGYSRTADYTRKTQALAEERKTFEAQAAGIREQAQRYDAGLAQVEAALKGMMPPEPNWDELRAQYPAEQVNAAWINYQRQKEQLAAVKAERERVAQEQFAAHQQAQQKYLAGEREKLLEVLPDFKDDTKGPALRAEMTAFAQERGFTLDELNNTTDHRAVLLLHDAMQYHKLLAKQKQVSQKVDEAIGRTAKPGTGNKGKAPPADAVARAEARFAKSGSDDDAVELLLAREAAASRRK